MERPCFSGDFFQIWHLFLYPLVETPSADMSAGSAKSDTPRQTNPLIIWGTAALLLASFACQNLVEMKRESCTMDETVHLPAGYTYLLKRDFRLNPEHPPLLKILCALPLLVLSPKIDFNDVRWISASDTAGQYEFGSKFLYSNDADRLLYWGRLTILLLAVLLGLIAFLWARRLYGNGAGLFALGLYAFSPNIIAHSHLVTTDVGVSAFLTMCFYFMWRYRCTRKPPNLYLSSVSMGAALASKFSAFALFPVALLVLWAVPHADVPLDNAGVFPREGLRKNPRRKTPGYSARGNSGRQENLWTSIAHVDKGKVREIAIFAGVALVTVQLSYIGSLDPTLFFRGMAQVNANHDPNFSYFFNGRLQPGGSWYYIPASFFLKATAAFVVLVLARAILFFARWRREWQQVAFLALPAAAYFVAITAFADPLGVRYLLPVFPFLMVFSAGLVRFSSGKRTASWVIWGLLACHIASSAAAFPHHLSYFNELAGGPSRGWEWLGDSNVDWDQELKALKQTMDRLGIPTVTLASASPYDDPSYYGISHTRPTNEEWIRILSLPMPPQGVYALSASFRGRMKALGYDWGNKYPMIANLGNSMFLFRVP